TGSSVCAATTPGSAAARPAPQMRTRSPRPDAVRAYSATASGVRCADRTSNSHPIPRASSSSSASCIRSRSDSDPTRIPTTTPSATRDRRDVPTEAHAFEPHPLHCVVSPWPPLLELRSERGHREDTSAVRDEAPVADRRATVEDERASVLDLVDALDRSAAVVASLRILGPGQDDGD